MELATASPVLRLDEFAHKAYLGERELVRVTTALSEAGIIESQWFTEESRLRGSFLHDAVSLHHQDDLAVESLDPALLPYWEGYMAFLAESRFLAESVEQPVHDEIAGYAGRSDLFGCFPDLPATALDLVDIKTGKAAAWVRLQVALYRRCLRDVPRCRRWVLELPGNGQYRLSSLNLHPGPAHQIDRQADQRDEYIGLSAVSVANWKRGRVR